MNSAGNIINDIVIITYGIRWVLMGPLLRGEILPFLPLDTEV